MSELVQTEPEPVAFCGGCGKKLTAVRFWWTEPDGGFVFERCCKGAEPVSEERIREFFKEVKCDCA